MLPHSHRSCDTLFLSLRTDSAWYRLEAPAASYAPWWAPLLKAARVSVRVLTMLAEEERAARLTLDALVKRLAEEPESSGVFVSAKPAEVERYISAHGQILLNQLRTFPAPAVRKSGVPAALRERMALRRHTALAVAKGKKGGGALIRRGGTNLNPVRSQAARAKPMRATVTRLVNRVWSATVAAAEEEVLAAGEAGADDADAVGAAADTGAGEDEGEEDAGAAAAAAKPTRAARGGARGGAAGAKPKRSAAAGGAKAAWVGAGKADADGCTVYAKMRLGTAEVALGEAVWLPEDAVASATDDEAPQRRLALVMKLWQEADGDCWVMARVLEFGANTVLRGAAADRELFLSPLVVTVPIEEVSVGAPVRRITRPWGFAHRAAAEAEDAAGRTRAAEREAAGQPREYFWRRMYYAERGAFLDVPADALDAAAHIAAVAAEEAKSQARSVRGMPVGFVCVVCAHLREIPPSAPFNTPSHSL
jgi:DNA (cytosine-5)-methyltransferase 1